MSPKRWIYTTLGVVFVGLAAIGAVLPGLPTTGFLILASACFARSSPWLEQKLIRNRFFKPFLIYLEPNAPIPTRARVWACLLMWAGLSISAWSLYHRTDNRLWPIGLCLLGLLGSVTIWRYRRSADESATDAQEQTTDP